jgi:hypothetical protein
LQGPLRIEHINEVTKAASIALQRQIGRIAIVRDSLLERRVPLALSAISR